MDIEQRRETVPALLVAIVSSRLRRLGIPTPANACEDAELRLYHALCAEDPASAYTRYHETARHYSSRRSPGGDVCSARFTDDNSAAASNGFRKKAK